MRKKIRIFMIGMSDHIGGVETYITNLCDKMDKNAFEVIYSLPRMEIDGKLWLRPVNRHNFIKYFRFWRRFFSENKFEVIYYNTCDIVSTDMLYFAKRANIPVRIIHSHCANDDWKLNFFQKIQEKYSRKNIDKLATHFFACSDEAGKWMFGSRKFEVIKNGIDYSKYQFDIKFREKCRSQLLLKDEMLIGVIGRLVKLKNPYFGIEVLEKVLEKNPKAKMIYIGEGECKAELAKLISEKKLDAHVQLLGSRSDVNEWMSAIDCLLMPSLFEGLPFTLVEAQAAGLPCIVSTAVPNEANITGLVKFINLEDDVEIWAEELIEACDKPRKMTSFQIVDEGYSIEDTAEMVSQIIKNSI